MATNSICRSVMLLATALSCSLLTLPGYSAERLPKFKGNLHKFGVWSPAVYSPDGHSLAGNSATAVKLLDTSSEKTLKTLSEKASHRGAMVFSPDGKLLAYTTPDHTVKVWNVSTSKLVHTLSGHSTINGLSFSRDGKLLATAASDKTIKVWDVTSGKLLNTIVNSDRVGHIDFVLDGHAVLSLDSDFVLKIWDADTGKIIRQLDGNHQSYTITADGKTVVSCTATDFKNQLVIVAEFVTMKAPFDGKITFTDLATGKVLRSSETIPWGLSSLAISPDNRTIAAGNRYDYSLGFYDAETGKELRRVEVGECVMFVQFAPDGRNVLGVWDNGGEADFDGEVFDYQLDKDDVLKERLPKKN